MGLPVERPYAEHSYVRYQVRVPERQALRAYLGQHGIQTAVHYPTPLHLDEPYRMQLGLSAGSRPVSERLAREILSLPVYPQMGEDDVVYVVDHLTRFYRSRASVTA